MNEWVEVERQLSGVWVRPEFTAIAGSSQAGLLLSQIVYWFTPGSSGTSKLRIKRESLLWLAKRRVDWAKECGISPRQYDTAIAKLIKLEVVETKIFHFAGHPTTHIRLQLDKLAELCKSQVGDFHVTKKGNPNHESVIPYTETTDIDYEQIKAGATAVAVNEPVGVVSVAVTHKPVEEAPRVIDDWVAERPGLAEQKLKTVFTIEEWMTKASDILKSYRQKEMPYKAVGLTANSLSMAWKRMFSEKYEVYAKDFTHKEVGQMRQYLQKTGELAPKVMEFVLKNWVSFVLEAKYHKGLNTTPERPVIGFLLQHHDVAVNLYLQSIAKPKPVAKLDKPEIVQKVKTKVKEPEDIATIEDVMAALAEYGTGK